MPSMTTFFAGGAGRAFCLSGDSGPPEPARGPDWPLGAAICPPGTPDATGFDDPGFISVFLPSTLLDFPYISTGETTSLQGWVLRHRVFATSDVARPDLNPLSILPYWASHSQVHIGRTLCRPCYSLLYIP